MLRRSGLGFVLTFLSIITATAWMMAANAMPRAERFGDYEIHTSAFNSTFLNPTIAQSYHIKRSPDRGLINIAILNRNEPVEAALQVKVSNLMGQTTELQPRLVDEGNARYYLAAFGMTNDEVLHFSVQVVPHGETQGHTVRFSQKFYEE